MGPPNDVHILIPKTSPEKRDFEDMIKNFEIGRLSWIIKVDPKFYHVSL